jgi:type VI secretion system secreted protein VgrG
VKLGELMADMAVLCALGEEYQDNRLLRIDFPREDGPKKAVLLVDSLKAKEEISRGFRFDVELLSNDERIPLKTMIGKMATISLVRNDGSLRYFNGYVTEFKLLRADGGLAWYAMALEPWLSFARLRKDNVSFQRRSVVEITETIFEHYRQRDWKTILFDEYPRITCWNQHNETDYKHLHRRWEEVGLHYWYEHRFDGHTLLLGDNTTLAEPIDAMRGADQPDAMHFRAESGSKEDDGIHQWSATRQIGSGSMLLASFDYKRGRPLMAMGNSLNQQGEVASYELYENGGAYAYNNVDDGDKLTQRRMEERDARSQYFEAQGNDRAAQPGRRFRLNGHFSAVPKVARRGEEARPSIAMRDYLILSVEHSASNNYQAGAHEPSRYSNSFVCVRQSIRWRPGRHYHSEPCANPGVQTAIVTGPPGEEIYTDSLGRVKIQFHWDRLGKHNEHSSPWIRVAMPMAGDNLGQINLPRVKQEVVVQFLDGNVDHPIITGLVYNRHNLPPWNLPNQRALSGVRSRELFNARRGNHLVFDDSKGSIQAQLKSDHLHSQLSLGNIVRIEDTAGRKDARGEGFELRTDGHGAVRAAKGMLITTEARTNAASTIKDMGETTARLNAARNEHEALADLAQRHGAQETPGQQAEVAAAIKAQNDALKGAGGNFPELSAPHLVLSSPAGIETSTAQSTHIASDGHTALTSGKSVSIASGESLFASISQTFRLFVHKAGMKLIAAAGDIDMQALTDNINLLAKLNITQTADCITISAKEEVVINGGGSYAKFNAGGIEHGSNGTYVAHAAHHSFQAPNSLPISQINLPIIDGFDEQFRLLDEQERPLSNIPYAIQSSCGKTWEGISDADGLTQRVFTEKPSSLSIYILSETNNGNS